MITHRADTELLALAQYLWVADKGRMLFQATVRPDSTPDNFRAEMGYSGPELGLITMAGDCLLLSWDRTVRPLRPGDTFTISYPRAVSVS